MQYYAVNVANIYKLCVCRIAANTKIMHMVLVETQILDRACNCLQPYLIKNFLIGSYLIFLLSSDFLFPNFQVLLISFSSFHHILFLFPFPVFIIFYVFQDKQMLDRYSSQPSTLTF